MTETTTDKLPPHCIEAEEAVLGSILIDPERLNDVRAIIGSEDFFRDRNQWIFEAMLNLDGGVDQITVTKELERIGKLDAIGGAAYLSHLVSITPTSLHARHYAEVVKRESFRRDIISTAGQIAALGYEGDGDSMGLFLRAQDTLSKLEPQGREEIIKPKEHAELMLAMLCQRREKRFDGISFGYKDLDDFIGGMYGGDFVIVGARPSVGKSQLLLEIALHNAKFGEGVLFASAEMSITQLTEREVVMGTGIDIRRLRKGALSEFEWDKAQEVVAEVSDIPLYFLAGKLSVGSIMQKAKVLKQTKGLDLVLVDYIQLLKDRADKRCGDNLRERIGYISNSLKNAAHDLEIPVIAASQFSRGVETREGHRPMLSDLKESGDLEQDADVVLLLHRPELYDPDKDKGILEIGIAKTRQLGLQGVVKLVWVEKEHKYRDITRRGYEHNSKSLVD
jgi:replicative DNA helicase